jgi:hypothetical protein
MQLKYYDILHGLISDLLHSVRGYLCTTRVVSPTVFVGADIIIVAFVMPPYFRV